MNVRIKSRLRKKTVPLKSLKGLAEKTLLKLGQPDVEIGLLLVNDPGIRRLNRDYRRKDKSTDVLAFSVDMGNVFKGPRTPPRILGDVVISVQTARRQAREAGHTLHRELGELFIHGLLHLLGYDHEQSSDARRMRTKELRLRSACLDR